MSYLPPPPGWLPSIPRAHYLHLSFHFYGPVSQQLVDKIAEAINSADDWLRYSNNCWILWTSHSPEDWYNRLILIPELKPHSIFIVRVDISPQNRSGQFPRWIWDWINKSRF